MTPRIGIEMICLLSATLLISSQAFTQSNARNWIQRRKVNEKQSTQFSMVPIDNDPLDYDDDDFFDDEDAQLFAQVTQKQQTD